MAVSESLSFRCRRALLAVVAAFALACGGGGGDGGTSTGPSGTVTLTLTPATVNLPQGLTRKVTVSITRQGSTKSPVTLAANNLPAGVTATFDPPSVSGSSGTSTLTLAAATSAQRGRTDLLLTATGNDVGYEPTPLTLFVFGPQVSVTRSGNGNGTVTSNPAGISCGGTCTGSFDVGPVTLTATPASGSTFLGWSGACVATTPTCTFTASVTTSNGVLATFAAPGFSFAVAPTSSSVQQGASATATVTVTRIGGFAGDVTVRFNGQPAGLTVTPNPATISGTSQTLTIAAAASIAAGNYPISVVASAQGAPQQSATMPVQVTPAPGGSGSIAFSFASCDPTQVPIWFAVQNDGGAWTHIPVGAASTFSFTPGARVGIAYVTGGGTRFSTSVLLLSGSEASSIAAGSICDITPQTGTRTLTTSAVNTGGQTVTVTLGGANTTVTQPAASGPPTITLNGFPAGRRDLIAARYTPNANNGINQLQKLIIRRNTQYPNPATPLAIDFGAAEAFAPTYNYIQLNNLGNDKGAIGESFLTTNGASESFFQSIGAHAQNAGVDFVPAWMVPGALLQPGDFHSFFVLATPTGSNASFARFAELLVHAGVADNQLLATINLGPPISPPAVTTIGTAPYLRERTQFASQAEYGAAANAQFGQANGDISMEVTATPAYMQGVPATWTLDVPDLSAAGYDPTWALKNGAPVSWTVVAIGGTPGPFAGAPPVDGAQIVAAAVSSAPGASAQLVRAWRARRR